MPSRRKNVKALLALGAAVLLLVTRAEPARADGGPGSIDIHDTFHQPEPPEPPRPKAPESPASPFGTRGQWVVTGASSIGASWSQYDGSDAHDLDLTFSPGVDYFVWDHLSLGVSTNVYSTASRGYDTLGNLFETDTLGASAGIRVGADLPLGAHWSFWPRFTTSAFYDRQQVSVVQAGMSGGGPSPATADVDGISLGLFAPLLCHPVPHFFFGLGPSASRAFTKDGKGLAGLGDRSDLSGQFIVGGWWGGAPPATPEGAAPAEASTLPRARFGDRSNLVMSSDFTTSVSGAQFSGAGGSSWQVTVGPGVDYFVGDHVAIGASLLFGGGNVASRDVGGMAYTRSSDEVGFVPRLSVDVPLGDSLSLLPRASVGFTATDNDLTEQGQEEKWWTTGLWVGAYVPLVAHVTSHFFIGFGPYLNRDVQATYSMQGHKDQNLPGTHVGASLLLGGWL